MIFQEFSSLKNRRSGSHDDSKLFLWAAHVFPLKSRSKKWSDSAAGFASARWLPTVAPFAEFWWSPKEAHPGPLPHWMRCFVRIQEDRTVIETCENNRKTMKGWQYHAISKLYLTLRWFCNRFMSVHVLFHASF